MNNEIDSKKLTKYALLALPLSFIGLPLYMHLPKFYYDNYGLPLAVIGLILFSLRIFDAIIDPILGMISDKLQLTQKKYFIIFGLGLGISFNAFFYLPHNTSHAFTAAWFGICTFFVYLFFSLLYINYYSFGLQIAGKNKVKLSTFREFSSFIGILTASVLPSILILTTNNERHAFLIFGLIFLIILLISLIILPKSVHSKNNPPKNNLRDVIYDPDMRLILILFFINTLPVSITSNLFSFYVDEVLYAKESTAFYLTIYFLAAAMGSVSVSLIFKSIPKTKLLRLMMIISALSFSMIYFIDKTNADLFYLVCIFSGFGLGGELVILPAIAADIIGNRHQLGNSFFGIWASCAKISLALAAGIFLPLISINNETPMDAKLTFYYGTIPLCLKISTILLLTYLTPNFMRFSNEKN